MGGEVVYRDRESDRSQLEVSTGGTLGVLFSVIDGADQACVSLSPGDVSLLHIQLGRWLEDHS